MTESMKRRRSEEHVACMGDLKKCTQHYITNLHRGYNLKKLGTDRRLL
jgi:hypothetical protein